MTPGTQLDQKLRRLAFLAETGDLPPQDAARLDSEADRALRRWERARALQDLARLMPGDSRWEVAGALADALDRFHNGGAWPRIRCGARPARSEMEQLCVDVLVRGGPMCQRSVWEVLRHGAVFIERTCATATG